MAIERIDKFLHWEVAPGGPGLGIESDKLAQCLAQINQAGLRGVFGAPCFGFEEKNLDFLEEIPFVERVWFWDVALNNTDGLYALTNLRHFGVHPKRPPVQFDRFPQLRSAVVELRPKDVGLDTLESLHTLHLWHYQKTTYAELLLPDSITELQLNWASPDSLEHLPPLPNLKRLDIARCRNLRDLGHLCDKYPQLEHLVISACGRVSVDEGRRAIDGLSKLRHAHVQGTALVSGG